MNNFATSAEREQMDLTGDNEDAFRQQKQMKKWDRKKKKMVTVNNVCKYLNHKFFIIDYVK